MTENPEWAAPCDRFIDYVMQIGDSFAVIEQSTRMATLIPGMFASFTDELKLNPPTEVVGALEILANIGERANEEVEDDFSLLRSSTLVGAWGALEAMVEDLVASLIEHDLSLLELTELTKIRIAFIEFQQLSEAERIRFLVAEVQRGINANLKKRSATKFEPFLGIFGLGGPVNEKVENAVSEAQNLRNVFAHRGGLADRRLVTSCPHLGYSIGDVVKVSDDQFLFIIQGLAMYGFTILNRCRLREGLTPIVDETDDFRGALTFPDND